MNREHIGGFVVRLGCSGIDGQIRYCLRFKALDVKEDGQFIV